MDGIFLWIYLLNATLMVSSLNYLYRAFFRHRLRQVLHWAVLLVVMLLLCGLLVLLHEAPPPRRILSVLFAEFIILCLYEGNVWMRFCVLVLHFIMGGATETVLVAAFLSVSQLSRVQIMQNIPLITAFLHVMPGIISLMFSFLFPKLFRRWNDDIELPLWEWIIVILFAAFTIFQLYFAGMLINIDSTLIPWLPILGSVLLFMTLVVFLILDRLASHNKIQQENIALQEQMHYDRLQLQMTNESYCIQRSLTHDFDNRLLTLEQLLRNQKSEEALHYIQEVRNRVEETEAAISTNNPIADAVLNQKYRQALKSGVGMQFLVSDLSAFPLSADEMVTVLSNLLDNALEACRRLSESEEESGRQERILVKILMEEAFATISIQNTALPMVLSSAGELLTTKKNQKEHGFGLRNCKKILKRSGFDFVFHYEDGWFQFTAMKTI